MRKVLKKTKNVLNRNRCAHTHIHRSTYVTHAGICSSPALKFRVVDVTEFLLAGVGCSVSEKFNEIQSGIITVCQRHVGECQRAATDCQLTYARK